MKSGRRRRDEEILGQEEVTEGSGRDEEEERGGEGEGVRVRRRTPQGSVKGRGRNDVRDQ